MKITGQTLRENREKQGLTTSEVALLIKVNTKTVVAIEEGDLDSLPAKTFLRGFVRSYGKLLKIDVESLMEKFYEEMGSTKPKLAIRDQNNEERRQKAIEQSMEGDDSPLFKKIVWGAVGIVAVVLIFFVIGQVEKYENESKTADVKADLKTITPIENTKEQKSDTAETKASEKSPAPSKSKLKKTSEEKKVAATKPAPEQKKESEKKLDSKIETNAQKKLKTELPKKEKVADSNKNAHEVILEAFDRITIKYSVNDGKNSILKLNEDDIRIIKGSGTIKLSISDGGSVNLVHNGKDLGVPGSLGSPLDLTLQ